jgi:hypothetical protein
MNEQTFAIGDRVVVKHNTRGPVPGTVKRITRVAVVEDDGEQIYTGLVVALDLGLNYLAAPENVSQEV